MLQIKDLIALLLQGTDLIVVIEQLCFEAHFIPKKHCKNDNKETTEYEQNTSQSWLMSVLLRSSKADVQIKHVGEMQFKVEMVLQLHSVQMRFARTPQGADLEVKATIYQLITGDRRYSPRWCLVWTSLYSFCHCFQAQPFDRMWNYMWIQLHIKHLWSWTFQSAENIWVFV